MPKEHSAPVTDFTDNLTIRTRELGHPLYVGMDPYLDQIPETFRGASEAEIVGGCLEPCQAVFVHPLT
jgi:hypothetical protein